MTATLMEWLTRFPALWAIIGILGALVMSIIGGAVWLLVLKKYGPAATGAEAKLVALHKQASELQESTLKIQKEHFEVELGYLKDEKAKIEAKFDAAEKDHHAKKNEWNAENLRLVTEVEQLRGRPDITTLFDFETKANARRESFYTQMGETMQAIQSSVLQHENLTQERISPMMETLAALLTQSKKQMRVLGMILRTARAVAKETDKKK